VVVRIYNFGSVGKIGNQFLTGRAKGVFGLAVAVKKVVVYCEL
jgi:hypothetical protein